MSGAVEPLDLVAWDDVALELELTETPKDPWLEKQITRASAAIAKNLNRTLQVQTYQDQFWSYRDPYPWQVPSGFMPLQLTQWPIATVPSIAGLAPPQLPVLSSVSAGSASAAVYYVRITYVTALGETAASVPTVLAVGASKQLVVTSPLQDPASLATGWNVYIGTSLAGAGMSKAERWLAHRQPSDRIYQLLARPHRRRGGACPTSWPPSRAGRSGQIQSLSA